MTPKLSAAKKPRAAQAARGRAAKAKPAKSTKAKQGARDGRPAKSRSTWHRLTWCGVRLAFRYQPTSLGGYYAHLEVRVMASPEGRPIPITDTDYRSRFVFPPEVEEAGGATAYLRHWLDREAKSVAYQRALARWRQPELF